MRARMVVLTLVVVAVAAACGSSSNEGSGSPSAQGTTPAATTPAPTATSSTPANCQDQTGESVFELVMQNTRFSPSCAIAKSSQDIKIENKDGILHNFSITGTSIDVDVQPDQTFNGKSAGLAPGTYSFFCKYHKSLGMIGTVVVQ